ncbi:MAG TPA: hypothetical protein VF128_08590, partial [Gemmatimonadaceae bacterium]
MKFTVSRTGAAALAAALFMFPGSQAARAQAQDSLMLAKPLDVKGRAVYNPQSKDFVVWLTWRDNPDAVSALVSPPDTTGWSIESTAAEMSVPSVTGPYNGDIDRTVVFQSTRSGTVGVDSLIISFTIRREEHFSGRLSLSSSYVPGTLIPAIFRDANDNNRPVDFGLKVAFSAGKMDAQGSFIVGLEDFEGFHIWRGVERDGSDLEIIGEVSKEEAFKGRVTGGSLADSVYFYDIIPTLRGGQGWISPFGPVDCLGTRIDLDLDSDQFFWFDCQGTNGYTYFYTVTTFDRGYEPKSSAQGLSKFDNCTPTKGTPYECNSDTRRVALEVNAQADLYNVYVVPNPVRTGTSRLTTDNYHNFPDGLVRFVNVPANCTIKIFTVSGDLVWINDHVDGTGNVEWDIRNLENEDVASG